MSQFSALIAHLQQQTGHNLQNHRLSPVGGGDINSAYHLQSGSLNWFIKINRADLLDMFAAEAAGLAELAGGPVRVPQVICHGEDGKQAYLVLEYLELKPLHSNSAARLGRLLAQLHRLPQAHFGWVRDNTIGSTPQYNPVYRDWVSFWREQRLGQQLQLAAAQGYGGNLQKQGEKLSEKLAGLFHGYQPQASLLHGDLWGGNAAVDNHANPIIYDPACYYGDREADIAMTELFGGFGAEFYAAYQAEWPLDAGYKVRKTLYNLYHILNHLNLFGRGYLGQADAMLARLLAELG